MADGISDINIDELIKFHKKSGKLGTITAVHNQSRFGDLIIEDEFVKILKKNQLQKTHGLMADFVFLIKSLEFLTDKKEESFEEGLLTRLTKENELAVYKHNNFWQCMDTNREAIMLNEIWEKGEAPWKIWN